MENRKAKSAVLGLVGGAGTWICGLAISRTMSSNACMNRPIGSCGNSNALLRPFNFMGSSGLTPLMFVTAVIAGAFMGLMLEALGVSKRSGWGMRLMVTYVIGLTVSMIVTYYLS